MQIGAHCHALPQIAGHGNTLPQIATDFNYIDERIV
jgi:hypothetical protein